MQHRWTTRRPRRPERTTVLDLVLILTAVAFFGATQLFARWLDGLEGRNAP